MDRYPEQVMARLAKFMGALRLAGMPDSFYQRVIDDVTFRDRLVDLVMEKLELSHEETWTQKVARRLMGANFLGVPEVVKHFGVIPTAKLLDLQYVPFSERTLRDCARTHILIADVGLSLLEVRQAVSHLGLFWKSRTFNEAAEFANRTEMARWRLIRKTPVVDSIGEVWSKQRSLVNTDLDEIPSARRITYAVILHFLVTGERLLEKVFVRTGDALPRGRHIEVGRFDSQGLYVCGGQNQSHSGDAGIASERKP